MREGVRVYVGGEAPGFRDFATSALRIIAVLEELAEYHDRENAEWTVTSAAVGSLATVLHAPECERVESIFIEGVARLRDLPVTLPDGWNHEAARKFALIKPIKNRRLTIGWGDSRRRQYEVDPLTLQCARELAHQPESTFFGSVIGELDKPQRVGGYSASLVEQGTGRRIHMKYKAGQLESVGSAWGALVEVSGQLKKTANGKTRSVEARSITPLGSPMRFEDIIGLLEDDPSFDPKAYLDEIRGA